MTDAAMGEAFLNGRVVLHPGDCREVLAQLDQADIRRRMALVLAGPDERIRESIKAKNLPVDYGPLFGFPEAAE